MHTFDIARQKFLFLIETLKYFFKSFDFSGPKHHSHVDERPEHIEKLTLPKYLCVRVCVYTYGLNTLFSLLTILLPTRDSSNVYPSSGVSGAIYMHCCGIFSCTNVSCHEFGCLHFLQL